MTTITSKPAPVKPAIRILHRCSLGRTWLVQIDGKLHVAHGNADGYRFESETLEEVQVDLWSRATCSCREYHAVTRPTGRPCCHIAAARMIRDEEK